MLSPASPALAASAAIEKPPLLVSSLVQYTPREGATPKSSGMVPWERRVVGGREFTPRVWCWACEEPDILAVAACCCLNHLRDESRGLPLRRGRRRDERRVGDTSLKPLLSARSYMDCCFGPQSQNTKLTCVHGGKPRALQCVLRCADSE